MEPKKRHKIEHKCIQEQQQQFEKCIDVRCFLT